MRILKKILIVLVVLVLLAAVIGLFMPRHVHVERSRTMKAPAENVFAQVNNLKNWNNWAPWNRMDPNWKQTWGNVTEGEGGNYSWESATDLGKGSMTITKSVPQQSIETELRMESMLPATGGFNFEKMPEGTKVTWSFDADMGANPFMKLMGSTMMSGMLKKQFDEGLEDLDSVAMVTPVAAKSNFEIEMTTVQPMHYMAVHDTASVSTISQKLGMHYGEIQAAMKKQNLQFAGPPIAIYYSDSQTNWEMDAGIPVDKAGKTDGNVKPGEMKGGNAVVAHYHGSYDNMAAAYAGLKKYITDNNKKIVGAPWEAYVTDPMTEKDPAKWLTNIYFPVE